MTSAIYNRPKTMEQGASSFNRVSFNRVSVPYNTFRNDTQFEIHLALPGVPKEEVSIEVEENKLIIRHNKPEGKDKNTLKVISKGFGIDNFVQKFNIPENVEAADITAGYDNGVLKVILPIKEKYHKKSIEVM